MSDFEGGEGGSVSMQDPTLAARQWDGKQINDTLFWLSEVPNYGCNFYLIVVFSFKHGWLVVNSGYIKWKNFIVLKDLLGHFIQCAILIFLWKIDPSDPSQPGQDGIFLKPSLTHQIMEVMEISSIGRWCILAWEIVIKFEHVELPCKYLTLSICSCLLRGVWVPCDQSRGEGAIWKCIPFGHKGGGGQLTT